MADTEMIEALEKRISVLATELEELRVGHDALKREQEQFVYDMRDRLRASKAALDEVYEEYSAARMTLDDLLPRDPNRKDAGISAGG